ncbi:MAG: hypothetical protein RQ767_06130, partial [Thermovirgaceae bacterium]|nr:hypothetical protein [Thermovirgaceae bacterium]
MALNFLKKMFGKGNGGTDDLFLPADQFRTLILHECARCDRNAHEFSLIHIDLRGRDQKLRKNVRDLARFLVKRMRTTDEVGWLDDHSIGVFLPETGREGADSLAHDTCQGYPYQIFTYPWLDNLRPGKENLGYPGGDNRVHESGTRPASEFKNMESPAGPSAYHQESDTGRDSGTGFRVQRVEDLIHPDGPPLWKRAYDVFGSSVLLLAFSPILALVV